ncbi:hypothetical protein HanPI659440_Chr03g0097411 [Helianthus annuus]|nr:hypothetical protein HanIR_Chr12g0615441 [Helianthus annuus]KAJ0591706.1 hypothetical protein HanHA300_Chr03g0076361 [Helianthus annuus]KAJ0772591.1 hypothetical protein HanOQP8_Chr03g0089121 [Helianthus annuus]KAJ0799953.1 hypothetical protein HanPI659440_Chr03g0097411 [Helianthus annuus]
MRCCQKAKVWDLGALGDPAAAGVPKQTHEVVVVPPLVPEVAGIPRTRLRKYEYYVVVSETLEGLGVPGGAAAAGGSTTGTKPVDNKQRKAAAIASRQKNPKFRKTRATVVLKPQTTVPTETREEPVSFFATPPSSPKVADVEVQKEGEKSPSIEVVSGGGGTPPFVHVEDTSKKTAGETIVDTLDSTNNLIDP